MSEKIIIRSIEYDIKELSSLETLEAINLAQKFKEEIFSDSKTSDYNAELVEVLCEFSVLSYYCLLMDNVKAFSSPLNVLQTLSIDDLCDVYDTYSNLRTKKNYENDEFSYNENFYKGGQL